MPKKDLKAAVKRRAAAAAVKKQAKTNGTQADPEFKVERVAVGELVPYEKNPRHNLQAIDKVAESIKQFGFRQPIVVDEQRVVIAGHTRLMAAKRLGLKFVPVHVMIGASPESVRAYRLADNRTAEEADWDDELLATELKELHAASFDLALTGFSAVEIDELLNEREHGHLSPDADKAGPVPKNPRTRLGDVWILGQHRLRCGDARRSDDVRAATGDRLADACWTDPPYNVDYVGKSKATSTLKIKNDSMGAADFLTFLLQVMRVIYKHVKDGAPTYVAHSPTEMSSFQTAFDAAGFKLSSCLVWRKDCMVLGRSDYQWQHEGILYGWKPGAPHPWFGGRKDVTFRELEDEVPFTQCADGSWQIVLGNRILNVKGDATLEELLPSVIEEKRPQRSGLHPTMKPTALIERMLKNSVKPGQLVLDPFGGSGSTLIACERLGMRAALVELDRGYCDVIVDRWQEYTGGTAHREGERPPAKPSKATKKAKAPIVSRGTPADAKSKAFVSPMMPIASEEDDAALVAEALADL